MINYNEMQTPVWTLGKNIQSILNIENGIFQPTKKETEVTVIC